MLRLIILRVLRLIGMGIISSLPIFISSFVSFTGEQVLAVSGAIFLVLYGIDSFLFSYTFWKPEDYFIGQLLPLVIYTGCAYATFFLAKARFFNSLFLTFRCAEIFKIEYNKGTLQYMKTFDSIAAVCVALIIIATILRLIGSHFGKKIFEEMEAELFEIEAFEEETPEEAIEAEKE